MTTHEGRLCLFCAHLWLDFGEAGYSEWTPGYGGEARCLKKHWELGGYESADRLADYMLLGETCVDFALSEAAPESVRQRAAREHWE